MIVIIRRVSVCSGDVNQVFGNVSVVCKEDPGQETMRTLLREMNAAEKTSRNKFYRLDVFLCKFPPGRFA